MIRVPAYPRRLSTSRKWGQGLVHGEPFAGRKKIESPRRRNIGDGGGVLALRGAYVEIADSAITGNAIDLDVRMVSRIGWQDTTIDTIDCDDSVLTFLDAVCPE